MGSRTLLPTKDQNAISVHNFGGINNLDAADRLTVSDLRDAVNVDLDKFGKLKRRVGRTSIYSSAGIRSLWSDGKQLALFAEGAAVKRLLPGLTTATLFTGISPVAKVAYCKHLGNVFFSDGIITRRFDSALVSKPWGLEMPSGQPTLTAIAGGALHPGIYQVAVTFMSGSGEESGAHLAESITLSGSQATIRLVGIPQPLDPEVTAINIYCSTMNGEMLYRVATVLEGTTTYDISNALNAGMQLRTQFLDPMPAGSSIFHYRGRLYVVKGNLLIYSEPLRYGLTCLSTNFIAFPSEIRVAAATDSAIFVVADKHYSIIGDTPDKFQMTMKLEYSAPAGEAIKVPGTVLGFEGIEDTLCAWMSDKGVVAGLVDGSVLNLTQDRVVFPGYDSVAVMYREEQGKRQMLSLGKSKGSVGALGVTDDSIADIRRNGVVIT